MHDWKAWLEMWGAKLDDLGSRAGKAGASARTRYRRRIERNARRDQTPSNLDHQVWAAAGESWEGFKASLESAWKRRES